MLRLSLAGLALAPAFASDVHVVVPGGGPGTFATIQGAVNAANDGDIILVRAGLYTEVVSLDGRSLALFGEGSPRVRGGVRVLNLAATETVLLAGLVVEAPSDLGVYRGAVDVRACQGPVRIQDCQLLGGDAAGTSPYFAPPVSFITASGGPGLLVDGALDVSLDAVGVTGGLGEIGLIFTGAAGLGGDAIVARAAARFSLARVVATGGEGGGLEDPGHGGAGLRALGATSVHLTGSMLSGGSAGCWGQQYSSGGWRADGGPGLVLGSGATAWRYTTTIAGGPAASGGCATPAGSSPGAAVVGPGQVQVLPGVPHTLLMPAIARTGQPWQVELESTPGHVASLRYTATTGVRFFPALRHPYLLGAAPQPFLPGTLTVPASGRLTISLPAFGLHSGVDGLVFWMQANVGPMARGAQANARAILLLDAAF